MWESFSSTCVGIVEKRLGLNLHLGAVNSVDALQLKGSSADGEFQKVGQKKHASGVRINSAIDPWRIQIPIFTSTRQI